MYVVDLFRTCSLLTTINYSTLTYLPYIPRSCTYLMYLIPVINFPENVFSTWSKIHTHIHTQFIPPGGLNPKGQLSRVY